MMFKPVAVSLVVLGSSLGFVSTSKAQQSKANAGQIVPKKLELRAANTPTRARRLTGSHSVSRVSVTLNKSEIYEFARAFSEVLVGSSAIADVVVLSDTQVYVLGKQVGTTSVTLVDQDKRLVAIMDVTVKPDVAALSRDIRSSDGGGGVRVRSSQGKVILSGTVPDARAAALALRVAPDGAVNALKIKNDQQVMLKVRYVEASRTAARALGVRWEFFRRNGGAVGLVGTQSVGGIAIGGDIISNVVSSTSGGSPFATVLVNLINSSKGRLDGVLSALEDRGVLRRLAEPNLIAMSGRTASFHAGGEFPVPVNAQTNTGVPTVTIQYKEFGVKLSFTPTVLANGVINLRLEPEVSEIDPANGVELAGVRIPGIIKRKANTEVQLRSGQSFAIAGLLQSQSQRIVASFPWLGTLPVIGALFRSTNFQKKETELVVIITAHLVRPVKGGHKLKTPLDSTLSPNDVDLFLKGKLEVSRTRNKLIDPDTGAAIKFGAITKTKSSPLNLDQKARRPKGVLDRGLPWDEGY